MKLLKFTLILFAVLASNLMAKAQEGKYSVALGSGVYANSTPHLAGNASLLVKMDEGGNNFSFTTLEMRGSTAGQPIYSTRTGLARLVQKSKLFSLYAIGTAGVSASGDATSGAFAGGGVLAIPVHENVQLLIGAQAMKSPVAGGLNPLMTVSFLLSGD